MQKKQLFNAGFVALALVASFLVLNGSKTPATQVKGSQTCCIKSVKCAEQSKPGTPAKTSLEHLSHQFISVPSVLY
jgi:hypothetical protein